MTKEDEKEVEGASLPAYEEEDPDYGGIKIRLISNPK